MAGPTARRLVDGARRLLAGAARRWPAAGRAMARAGAELRAAAVPDGSSGPGPTGDLYGGSYFGQGRDPSGDRQGRSGYASYDRVSSNADIAAYLLWRNVRARSSLDVGCATGYLVEALRDLGVEAEGCDASDFAVHHPAPGAAGHLRRADPVAGLPYADGTFDLVSALEILEHLAPTDVPRALAELRRVCRGVLYATIPSYGPNRSGPDGHFEGKVRPERLAHYRMLDPVPEGPLPLGDLAVDAEGRPVEGHLTIASYEWWTARLAEAGLERLVDVERRLYADLAPTGLGAFWNLYLCRVPDAPSDLTEPRAPEASLADLGLRHPLLEAGGVSS